MYKSYRFRCWWCWWCGQRDHRNGHLDRLNDRLIFAAVVAEQHKVRLVNGEQIAQEIAVELRVITATREQSYYSKFANLCLCNGARQLTFSPRCTSCGTLDC